MVIYTSRSSLMELTLSNNAYRAKQAQTAADAGLDFALATYLQGTAVPTDGASQVVDTTLIGGKRAFYWFCAPETTFADIEDNACDALAGTGRMRIFATGYSDDDTAVARATVLISEENALSINPKAALTAKGSASATLNGNLTVINNMSPTTIWTGTDIGAMTGSFETQVSVNGSDYQKSSEKVGNKFYLGPDVVYNDHSLHEMSYADYFTQMTGRTPSEMAALADIRISGSETLPTADASNDYLGGKIIYVDKATFDPNVNLGTTTNPVILVVNGDFGLNGPNTINGIVVAKNLNKANGNARINGALIVENIDNANGGFTIEMVPSVINNLDNITVKSTVGNSWRDWD